MRAELSILTDMAQKGESQRFPRKNKELKRNTNNNKPRSANSKRISENEIQAKAKRIRRYVKRSKQFSQNQTFANNRQKVLQKPW